jgi:hypothetical protein
MPIENIHTLIGTLYAKECRKVPNTKKPTEPDWEFYSIKVEIKMLVSGRTITQIPELSLEKGLSYDGYEIGDKVEVDFYLTGKSLSEKWYKTEAKANYIKFAPLQEGEMRVPRKAMDTGFETPRPSEVSENTDIDDNLPF